MGHYGEAVLADENGQMRAAAQAGHLPDLSRKDIHEVTP